MSKYKPDITDEDIEAVASGKFVTCKKCGEKDLVWKKNSVGSWRLAKITGHWHYCKEYYDKR